MRDSEPQSCNQQHKQLKVTQNATNRDKHKNQASKQKFVQNLSNNHVYTRKVCFPIGRFVSMSSMNELRMKFL